MTKDATEGAKSGTTAAANAELYSMGPRAHLEVLYEGFSVRLYQNTLANEQNCWLVAFFVCCFD